MAAQTEGGIFRVDNIGHKKERSPGPTWMNLGNIMLRERRQKQRPACFYLYEKSRIGKPMETGGRLMVSRAWWERRNEE